MPLLNKVVNILTLISLMLLMPSMVLAQDPTAEPTEEAREEAMEESTNEAIAEDADGVVCESDVVVQSDDWLSKIAEKAFGDVLTYQAIADASNAKAAVDSSYTAIEDVNVIEPGWRLCIPSATYAESVLGLDLATVDSGSLDSLQIPTIEEGKTNVAFIYSSPIGDGGWTYAQNEGRRYVESVLGDTVNTAYLESVPEGADSERVIRNLARQGFDVIFGTSLGYMDPLDVVAEEFPDIAFVNVTGQKKNDTNFGNASGALEEMQYLAGMIAGAKAAEDGSYRVGIVVPFPIADVLNSANGAALGMKRTCPNCVMDIRWLFSWFDPVLEREAAASMLDAGATVIIANTNTPSGVQVAADRGLTGSGVGSENTCFGLENSCLTVSYWDWGPVYADIVAEVQAGTWVPENYYGTAANGLVGLYGFMEGQEPYPNVPASVIPEVEEVLAQMQAGEFTSFDIFAGPLNDNQGNEVVPAGTTPTLSDLRGLSEDFLAAFNIVGREPCTICTNYLVEGFDPTAEVPPLN